MIAKPVNMYPIGVNFHVRRFSSEMEGFISYLSEKQVYKVHSKSLSKPPTGE